MRCGNYQHVWVSQDPHFGWQKFLRVLTEPWQRESSTDLAWLHIWLYFMNSMKLAIPLRSSYWSIHTKDESKRGTAFAFIFGVN